MMANNYMLGYKGIFNRYTVKRNLRSWVSLLIGGLSMSVCVWLFISKDFEQIVSLLNKIIDSLLNCLPDLLGFCIGGYAILVAINNLEKMSAVLEKQEKRGLSYYINLSADFAMTLLLMSALLLFSFVMRLIMDLELTALSIIVGKIVNLIVILLLIWVGLLVIVMIMGTIANIFNMSIILQTVAKLSKEEDNKHCYEHNNSDTLTEEKSYEVKSWFGTYIVKKTISKRNNDRKDK